MRKVNQERFEERQRHIREAALACFRRSGFHRASMADICAEAQMSAGNLYRYYDSKEAIIAAICEHDRQDVTRRFEAMRGRPDLFAAMLELTGEAMDASAQLEKSKFGCEVLAEAMRNERVAEIVRRHHAALLEVCADGIAYAQAMKQIDPDLDPKLAATLLIAAGDGLGLKLALHSDLDAKQCIETFKLLVLRFLRPRIEFG
jgi:AcrR family transcriptional regulator